LKVQNETLKFFFSHFKRFAVLAFDFFFFSTSKASQHLTKPNNPAENVNIHRSEYSIHLLNPYSHLIYAKMNHISEEPPRMTKFENPSINPTHHKHNHHLITQQQQRIISHRLIIQHNLDTPLSATSLRAFRTSLLDSVCFDSRNSELIASVHVKRTEEIPNTQESQSKRRRANEKENENEE
jgi:hypothetical protein